MRRKATIGGPDRSEDTARPAERGASGYRRFGASSGRTAVAAAPVAVPRAGRVATVAGVATTVALGGAAFAPLADVQVSRSLPTPSAGHDGAGCPGLGHRRRRPSSWSSSTPSAPSACPVGPRQRTGAVAPAQAANIASAGTLYHQELMPLLGAWQTAGENVGFGPSVTASARTREQPRPPCEHRQPDLHPCRHRCRRHGRRAGVGVPGVRRLSSTSRGHSWAPGPRTPRHRL